MYVDYPGEASLVQIYGTFNRAMLRLIPSLRAYAEPLTNAMVELYLMSQVCQITFVTCENTTINSRPRINEKDSAPSVCSSSC